MQKSALATVRYLILVMAAAACAPAPPPPAAPPPAPAIPPFPAAVVWSAKADLIVQPFPQATDSAAVDASVESGVVPRPFTRLEVLGRDSLGLLVRCLVCQQVADGYVDQEWVIYHAFPPEVAAWGTLSEFSLSIREAAVSRDLEGLMAVMAPDFSFSFVGVQSPGSALDVWASEDFRTLERIPELLDEGLSTTTGRIWSAPPAFTADLHYRGLRLGFRQRPDGRWEWLYLIAGIRPE